MSKNQRKFHRKKERINLLFHDYLKLIISDLKQCGISNVQLNYYEIVLTFVGEGKGHKLQQKF